MTQSNKEGISVNQSGTSGLEKKGWGIEDLPYPKDTALVQARWDLCIGCGACEVACSLFHHGVINRGLSRIRIYHYLLPVPKAVQNICCNCSEKERECQKACPQDPPVIHYDDIEKHMSVDAERCLGSSCALCQEACPAHVPQFYPPDQDHAMVCDLCYRDGQRRPQCVEICPFNALEFMSPSFPQHMERIHPDEKARALAKRLYPLTRDKVQKSPEEIFGSTDCE
jgi:anaerobic carbon-monoxide dehydrogenase iron sulfur subunit